MNKLPKTLRIPLKRALDVKRPSGSIGEAQFRAWLCKTYAAHLDMIDEAGNLHFVVGNSETIFAAHCDTCHDTDGVNAYEVVGCMVNAKSECLGADDGAGVALLCYMMSNGKPGRYIFTTAEEVGGTGSQYIADIHYKLLAKYKRSICFDRAGTSEIITVQGGQRCASKEFAEALSCAFAECGMLYSESIKGTFTDNKLWANDIPCNVNIGVGYYQQHGPSEHLDLGHYRELAAAILTIDWESLPTERNPESRKTQKSMFGSYSGKYSSGFSSKFDPVDYGRHLDDEAYDEVIAAMDGDTAALKQRLAEELYPQDPVMGGRYIDMKQISKKHYQQALDMYEDQIITFLLDLATVAEARL